MATRMSQSAPWNFLLAEASADSTASNTTSRSTLFSREMASTSISISRFMSTHLLRWRRRHRARLAAAAPLEIEHRHQARLAHLVEREVERLPFGLAVQCQPPALRPGAEAAAVVPATVERLLQAHRDQLSGKALVVGGAAQRPVEPGRRHLEPGVVDLLDLQRVLQLPRHALAVVDR